jgi:PKD repeat protein
LGTITAQGQNSASGEVAANAFDNSATTKWLDFANAYPSTRSSWIQYQYPSARQFNLTQYTITSANDHAERDPANWHLLGSNNGGVTWTTLDIQTNQVFTARYQRLAYNLTNNSAFNIYRLQIDSVANPATANSVQLSELEFITLPPPYSYSWSFGDGTLSSAQNPQHTFASNGLYAVTLVVSDGLSSVTNNVLVSVGPPSLVLSQGAGTIQLSWPAWTTNYSYHLYSTTNLVAPAVWAPVTNSVVDSGGVLSVTIPLGSGNRFFQLRGP